MQHFQILSFLFIMILNFSLAQALDIPRDAKLVAATVAKFQDKQIVTLNDVKISKAIEKQILQSQGQSTVIAGDVQFDDVSKTVLEKVSMLEAETFKYSSYDESLFLKVKTALLQNKTLEPYGLKNEKEIEPRVKEKLIAKSFIALRSENLKTVVNETELRSYYEKNRSQFVDMPFDKFQNTIREYYLKEQLKEKLNEWFSVMKTKYKVRIYEAATAPKSSAE